MKDAVDSIPLPAEENTEAPHHDVISSETLDCPVRMFDGLSVNFSVTNAINTIDHKTSHPGELQASFFGPVSSS